MNPNKSYEMKIESEAFDALREDLNKVLTRTLANMEKRESEQAVITTKLTITLVKATVPDYNSAVSNTREICKPKIEHKVGSVMQIKDEESGALKGEYELVWDPAKGDYVIRQIDNGQIDLFTQRDEKGDIIYDADYTEKDDEQRLIEDKLRMLVEGNSEESEDEDNG